MRLEYSITVTGDKAAIVTPYSLPFTYLIKQISGARWNSSKRAWIIDARDVPTAKQIMHTVFGCDGTPAKTLAVTLHFPDGFIKQEAPIYVFGRAIAVATSRDSGARWGEGVICICGSSTSGGSTKHWTTEIDAGTVLIVHDVPSTLNIAKRLESVFGEDTCTFETSPEPPVPEDDPTALRAEREKLMSRIAEIDTILGETRSNI